MTYKSTPNKVKLSFQFLINIPPLTKNFIDDLPMELLAKHNNCDVIPLIRNNFFVIVMISSVLLDTSMFALDLLTNEPRKIY